MEKKHQNLQNQVVAGNPKNVEDIYPSSIKNQLQVGEHSDLEDGQVEDSNKHNLESQNAGNGNNLAELTQARQKDPKIIFFRSRDRQTNTKLIHKLIVKPNENLEEERIVNSKVSSQEIPSISREDQSLKQQIDNKKSLEDPLDGQVLSLDQYIQQNKSTTQSPQLDIRQRQSVKYSATNRFNVTLSNIESDYNYSNNGNTPLRQSFKGSMISKQFSIQDNRQPQLFHQMAEQTLDTISLKEQQQNSPKSGNEQNMLGNSANPQFHQQQLSQQQQSLFKQFQLTPPPPPLVLPVIRAPVLLQVGSNQSKPVDPEQIQQQHLQWQNNVKNSHQPKNLQSNNYFPVHEKEDFSQQQQRNQQNCQPRSKLDYEQLPMRQNKQSTEYQGSDQLREQLEQPRDRKEKMKVYSPIYIPEKHETIETTQSARKRDMQIEREDIFDSGKKNNSLRSNPSKIYGQNLDNSNSKSSSFFKQSPSIIPQSQQLFRQNEHPAAGEMNELAPLRQYKSKSTNFKESSLDNHQDDSLLFWKKPQNSVPNFGRQQSQPAESSRNNYSSTIISDQFKKERLHEQIHQRLQEINKRLQRQKQPKYHTIHSFHRLHCSSVQFGEDTLQQMNFAEFSQYFKAKLERSSSPSLEREFGISRKIENTKNYLNKRIDRSRSRSSKTQRIRDDKRYQNNSKEIKRNSNNFLEISQRNYSNSENKLNSLINEQWSQDESRTLNLKRNTAEETFQDEDILKNVMEYHTDDSDSSQMKKDSFKGSKTTIANNFRTLVNDSNLLNPSKNIIKRAEETKNEDEHQIDYDFDP